MGSWQFFITQSDNKFKILNLQKIVWPQIWEKKLNEISKINDSWRYWLNHIADVGLKNINFVNENLEHIKFYLTIDSSTFWIEFCKSGMALFKKLKKNLLENYPITLPKWDCKYYSLFSQFLQNQKYFFLLNNQLQITFFRVEYGLIIKSNTYENYIKQLSGIFKKFSFDLNNVFCEIKNLNSSEFELVFNNNDNIFELDEIDLNLIIVRIRLKNFFNYLTIILYLDVNDIFAYPNRILTNPMLPEFLQKINPSKWDLERHLYDNLLILFDDFLSK